MRWSFGRRNHLAAVKLVFASVLTRQNNRELQGEVVADIAAPRPHLLTRQNPRLQSCAHRSLNTSGRDGHQPAKNPSRLQNERDRCRIRQ